MSMATNNLQKSIHLFNCDNLYPLDVVAELLTNIQPELPFELDIHQHVFNLSDLKKLSNDVSGMEMDYAVFVVHANESRLSINEKDAGIGYGAIFKALLKQTCGKTLVVIGGDKNYQGEETRQVLSQWVHYKIMSQFETNSLNGVKSFVFSWNKKPHTIHFHAIKHFFNNNGEIFKFAGSQEKIKNQTSQQSSGPMTNSSKSEIYFINKTDSSCSKERDQERTKREDIAQSSSADDEYYGSKYDIINASEKDGMNTKQTIEEKETQTKHENTAQPLAADLAEYNKNNVAYYFIKDGKQIFEEFIPPSWRPHLQIQQDVLSSQSMKICPKIALLKIKEDSSGCVKEPKELASKSDFFKNSDPRVKEFKVDDKKCGEPVWETTFRYGYMKNPIPLLSEDVHASFREKYGFAEIGLVQCYKLTGGISMQVLFPRIP